MLFFVFFLVGYKMISSYLAKHFETFFLVIWANIFWKESHNHIICGNLIFSPCDKKKSGYYRFPAIFEHENGAPKAPPFLHDKHLENFGGKVVVKTFHFYFWSCCQPNPTTTTGDDQSEQKKNCALKKISGGALCATSKFFSTRGFFLTRENFQSEREVSYKNKSEAREKQEEENFQEWTLAYFETLYGAPLDKPEFCISLENFFLISLQEQLCLFCENCVYSKHINPWCTHIKYIFVMQRDIYLVCA